jgi:hypothetical protein
MEGSDIRTRPVQRMLRTRGTLAPKAFLARRANASGIAGAAVQ